MVGEVAGESRGVVVARRFLDLTGAGDDDVEAGQEQHPLGDQQDALPKRFEGMARRRLQPAEAAAVDDRGLGGVAQVVQVVGVQALGSLDRRHRCRDLAGEAVRRGVARSEEHTYELQSLMRISYAVFCLKKT